MIEAKRVRLALLGQRTGADQAPPGEETAGGGDAVAVAREAAAASFVLLRNEGALLPLPATTTRLAVLGPNGDREVIQGGGSARVTPTDVATIADGLRERLGDGVVVEPGVVASRGTPAMQGADLRRADGTVGVDVEILGADGAVRRRLRPRDFRVVFLDDPAGDGRVDAWSARATATFTPRVSGVHRFKIKTNGEATLTADGARDRGDRRPGRRAASGARARGSQRRPADAAGRRAPVRAARAARRLRPGGGGGGPGRGGAGRRRPRQRLGDRGPRPHLAWRCRVGRSSSSRRWRRSSPARWWRWWRGRRSTCRGPARSPACSGAGCRARRVAGRWPTCCSATPTRADACRAPSPPRWPTRPRCSTPRPIRACSATRRACSPATAGTTCAGSSRRSPSASG